MYNNLNYQSSSHDGDRFDGIAEAGAEIKLIVGLILVAQLHCLLAFLFEENGARGGVDSHSEHFSFCESKRVVE